MIVEIRTYRLHPGEGKEFVRVMREQSIPLLIAAGIDVLACGGSLVAEEGHEEAFLIRAFVSLEQHRQQEADFYASRAWIDGPRQAIVSRIESMHSVTLEMDEAAVVAIRQGRIGIGRPRQ